MRVEDAISRACSVDGCDRIIVARGYCNRHWKRWKRYGDPLAGRTPEGEPMRWLETVALPWSHEDCLIWPYADAGNGYGRIWTGERSAYAHRIVCEKVHGPAPSEEAEAAHSCGNGHLGCVNPNHLRWDDRTGNFSDKVDHGTHNRGERHHQAKLTEADVRQIKKLEGFSQREIAEQFGVSEWTVRDIVQGRRWGWLQ